MNANSESFTVLRFGLSGKGYNVDPMANKRVGLLGGTGLEGQGIATRLAAAGTELRLGSRSEARALEVCNQLNAVVGSARIRSMTNRQVVAECGLLFLTVPFQFAADLLSELADDLTSEHVLVDVSVPLRFEKGVHLIDTGSRSGCELLRQSLPAHVPMAAAFKTLPAHLLTDLAEPLDCDEFICWDTEAARDRVRETVSAIPGIRWLDGGPLRFCRALEAMTMLVVGLNRRYKTKHGRFRVVGLPDGS